MFLTLSISALVLGASATARAESPWIDAARGEQPAGSSVVRAGKLITCADEGVQVVEDPVMVIADGEIVAIHAGADVEGLEWSNVTDYGDRWLAPGFIDLHSHVGGSTRDINDTVYQVNSELRVAPVVIPNNSQLERPLAAGVTTILFIPGSGTNIGGQGVLMKLGEDAYEDALVRDPGSLKIAQGDNPTRWGYGMGRTQVSTHTQYYQLVLMSITLLARDFGLPTYIDHGSFDSYLTTPLAMEHGVAAILGPREIMIPRPPRFDTDGRIEGTAWGFQEAGMPEVGFNTDAPVVPQEELSMQAAMGVRYGLRNERGQGLRGVTIVPARTAGIAHRVGSLEVGKDADFIVTDGDPIDPRTAFAATWVNGVCVYCADRDGRSW